MASDPDKLTRLGDALDAAEREFVALHPQRPAGQAIWNSRVGEAFDRYRKAVRQEVTKRPHSDWCRRRWLFNVAVGWESEIATLRECVDVEAEYLLLNVLDREVAAFRKVWWKRVERRDQRRQRWRDARRRVKPL